jgi:hypothetical protein
LLYETTTVIRRPLVYPAVTQWVKVKVRIRKTPDQEELDGIRLADMRPGAVREVSSSIGAWLVVERYAIPEMRSTVNPHEDDFLVAESPVPSRIIFAPRRRRSDWEA